MKTYIKLILVSLVFSLGGTLIKTSTLMVSTEIISFLRFLIGALILFFLLKSKKRQIKWHFTMLYIWIAAFGKSINYITENYGVSKGFSYGNILIWPIQTIIIIFVSIFIFKERISILKGIAIVLCTIGIGLISWNGTSLKVFLGENLMLTIVFVIAGTGSAVFTIMQKVLVNKLETKEAYLSIFTLSSIMTFIPIPALGKVTGTVNIGAIISILILGCITGISFLVIADAMKTIPLYIVSIIQSFSTLFSLLWAILFFNEEITLYTALGTVVFVVGLIMVNLKFDKVKDEVKI
jgi:Predicted permeases